MPWLETPGRARVGVMAHVNGELVAVGCHADELYWFETTETDGAVSPVCRTASRPSS